MITIQHITKQYKRNLSPALTDVCLDIPCGVYGLLGRNGAGKTTLLRIMASVLAPTDGAVLFNGKPIGDDIKAFRRNLGFLPQNTKLMPELNIVEFLEYMCLLKGIRGETTIKQEIERLLIISGLSEERKKRLGAYSGGMLRRAGIAQTLIGNPEVLIVDEPTTGLDPEERLYFLNLISRIGADKTVVLSTHIIHDIENVCPNVCILEKGHVMYAGCTEKAVESVTGRVWSAEIKAGDEENIKKEATVTNITYVNGKPHVRYIAESSVYQGSLRESATLEDAFVYTVGGVSR